MAHSKKILMQDDPAYLLTECELNNLKEISNRAANKGTFDVARLQVQQIWDIMRDCLTKDRRDGRTYHILHHRNRSYDRAPTQAEMFDGAYLTDPWITHVKIQRMRVVSRPLGGVGQNVKNEYFTHGYIDVVYTTDGYAFYGVKHSKGKEVRHAKPFLTTDNLDSLRVDMLPLVVLRSRLNVVIASKTPG